MKIKLVAILILCIANSFLAQEKVSLQDIILKYESLEYNDVISLTANILKTGTLNKNELIEVYTMKAVSHFALSQEVESKNCFIEILKLDKNFNPDPVKVSPKIILFFNDVKEEFLKTNAQVEKQTEPEKDSPKDSILAVNKNLLFKEKTEFKNYLMKSIILPGWGHLSHNGSSVKGWLLTSASILNTGALIYFIIDADKKEKDYLNQSDEVQIKSMYNKFNTSFKTRNVLITSLVAIWLYAQADLLLFSFDDMNADINLSLPGNTTSEIPLQLNFNLKF
ncbi:MAG: hypothetical protein C4539_15705 [Ignavibacteriales bacterium]|nr:MAG: hypothetical protein C4539_15705 [Ignavibacteriales bacterium]